MKALLKKDLYEMLSSYRSFGIAIIICAALTLTPFGKMYLPYLVLFPSMIADSLLGRDQYGGWEKTAALLPVSRRTGVSEKFFLALIMAAAGTVLALVCSLIRGDVPEGEIGGLALSCAAIGLTLPAFTLPFTYKFGVEKARFFRIFIMLGLYVLVSALGSFGNITGAPAALENVPGIAMLIPSAALFAAAWALSAAIQSKKELA
ncbi:MAG: ABC-2 transporter permease [Oscillospiraceae bacterium]|nr:ABC-2 transporter permease [Oscillospiraceae bacterium]